MNKLTQEELRNLLALTHRANITGQEAVAVAMLQQKLSNLLKEDEKPQSDTPKV